MMMIRLLAIVVLVLGLATTTFAKSAISTTCTTDEVIITLQAEGALWHVACTSEADSSYVLLSAEQHSISERNLNLQGGWVGLYPNTTPQSVSIVKSLNSGQAVVEIWECNIRAYIPAPHIPEHFYWVEIYGADECLSPMYTHINEDFVITSNNITITLDFPT